MNLNIFASKNIKNLAAILINKMQFCSPMLGKAKTATNKETYLKFKVHFFAVNL